MRQLISLFAIVVVVSSATCADDVNDLLKQTKAAMDKKDYPAAVKLGLAAVKADGKNTDARYLLAMAYYQQRDHKNAVAQFSAALELDPKWTAVSDTRGDAYLKLGEFAKAIADYDVMLEANPKFAPQHWRRGIALYYAGRFEDGVKQFETHKTVNPEDVENAAWHYLCNVKVAGKEKAQKALIAVTGDTRVPMAEIQKLFAGKLKPEDVLAAADKTKADTRAGISARFYANLYVALWYEAEGEAKKVREHLTTAVEKYEISDYMWDVGNAHLQLLKAKDKK